MTAIAFHLNAPDKLVYACRFARKALRNDARLVITAPAQTLSVLDQMMWAMAPHDFVAHCRDDADADLVAASPVLLAVDVRATPHHEVLLNLHSGVPEGFARFGRVVEIVGVQDEEHVVQEALARRRHYESLGYVPKKHDLALKAA